MCKTRERAAGLGALLLPQCVHVLHSAGYPQQQLICGRSLVFDKRVKDFLKDSVGIGLGLQKKTNKTDQDSNNSVTTQ